MSETIKTSFRRELGDKINYCFNHIRKTKYFNPTIKIYLITLLFEGILYSLLEIVLRKFKFHCVYDLAIYEDKTNLKSISKEFKKFYIKKLPCSFSLKINFCRKLYF